MRQFLMLFILANLLSFLSGCSTIRSPQFQSIPWPQRQAKQQHVKHWQAQGTINIILPNASQSAYFNWDFQSIKHYKLHLFGPLGLGSTQLTVTPQQAQLTTSQGKRYTAPSAQALLIEHTPWRLPLKYLYYWVRALPAPHTPTQKRQFNQFHQLKELRQHNWYVQFLQYQPIKPKLDLPRQLKLKGPKLKVTVTITNWQLTS